MKKVIFTFDDAILNHLTFVAPLLKSYGFGATFFVGSFPCEIEERSNFMTWDDCVKLSKMGFDIGNHTISHADLGALNKAQQLVEIESVEDELVTHGIPRPVSFAYPCCKYNADTLDILRTKGYRFARIGGEQLYTAACDPLLVPSFPVHGDSCERFLAALKQAEAFGSTAVMMFHGVPDRVHPWVNTPQELFKQYCKILKQQNYKVGSMLSL